MQDNTTQQPFDPLTSVLPVTKQSPIGEVEGDIKSKNPIDFGNIKNEQRSLEQSIFKPEKLKTTNYETTLDQAYTKLNSGDHIARFDNFLPGVNNEERLAQQQSSVEKWGNGMSKLVGKTVTAVLGGTIGTVNGIINGIAEGSLEATYNNGFNSWLDDLNTKMDNNLPNYYTEQEKNFGLGKSLTTANFWANDVTSGLSFTLGTIVSEGIWAVATGGVGNAAKWGAKALTLKNSLAGLSKFKGIAGKSILRGAEKEVVDQVQKTALRQFKVKQLAENARFLVTSAGYEAGVEARHYMKSTEENWLNSFEELNGRPPTQQERTTFNDELTNVANRVFGANVGLVGASNLAVFGKMLGNTIITPGKLLSTPVNPTIKNSLFKNKILGVGYKTIDGKKVALEATKVQKVARGAYTFGKYGALEGFVEEGGQGVITSTGENFMLDTYSSENIDNSIGLMDSMIKGFEESYGTKEGQKSIGIGFIIGLFGGGIATKGRFNDLSTEQKEIEGLVNKSNKVTSELFVNRIKELSRLENAAKAESKAQKAGDLTGEITARRSQMQMRAIRDIRLGGTKEGLKDLEAYLNKTTDAEIAEAIGVEVTEEDAINNYRSEIYNEYKNVAEKTQKNLNFTEAILGQTPIAGASQYQLKDLAEAMGFDLTMGEVSDEIADEMVESIKEIVVANLGVETGEALTVENTLRKVESKYRKELKDLGNVLKLKKEREQQLTEKIVDLQNVKTEDNQGHVAKLAAANKQLLKIQQEIFETESKRQLAFDTANIPTLSNGEVTLDMLDNQKNVFQMFKLKLNSLAPNDKQNVETLIKNYEAAVRQTKQYNKAVQLITDPTIRVKRMKGWLSKLINKNKELDSKLDKYFQESIETAAVNEASQEGALSQLPKVEVKEETANTETNAVETPTNIQKLEQEIEEILEENSFLKQYVGDEIETELQKEDTDRFSELLNKVSIDPQTVISTPYQKGRGLNKKETQELKDLNQKLNDWRVIDGSGIGDKLKLIEALKTEVENENTQTKTEVSQIVIASSPTSNEDSGKNENAIKSPSIKMAKLLDRGVYEISHMEVTSLLDLIPGSTLSLKNKDISEVPKSQLKKEGNKFILKTPDQEIEVIVRDYSRIEIDKEQLDTALPANTKFQDLGRKNYIPLYKDGKFVEGDFFYQRKDGSIVNYNENATNEVDVGDNLILEVDVQNDYNQELLSQYRRKKNPITKQQLANQIQIYTKPKDQPNTVVGSLPRLYDDNNNANTSSALANIRSQAVELLLNGENQVEVGIEVPVTKVIIGNPNIEIGQDGTPTTIPFTNESVGQVVATGYIQDKEIKTNKGDDKFSKKIVEGIARKNSGKKIPIVVFKYGKQVIAYPVNLIETTVDLSKPAEDILNTQLDSAQMAEQFVKYLQLNKIDPQSFGIDYSNPNWSQTQGVDVALDILRNKKETADIETWTQPDFATSNLIQQAQISIDITNRPVHASKIIVDLNKKSPTKKQSTKSYKEQLEDKRITLMESLSKEAIELDAMFQNTDELGLTVAEEDSDFLMALQDDPVTKEPVSYAQHNYNANKVQNAFSNQIPAKVKKVIGKEKIDQINQKIEELNRTIAAENNTLTLKPLTDEEINGMIESMLGTGIETAEELLPELQKGFYNGNLFAPTTKSLVSTRLYNLPEAERLLNDTDSIQRIQELILKLQNNEFVC